jgi:hypothetical protein
MYELVYTRPALRSPAAVFTSIATRYGSSDTFRSRTLMLAFVTTAWRSAFRLLRSLVSSVTVGNAAFPEMIALAVRAVEPQVFQLVPVRVARSLNIRAL